MLPEKNRSRLSLKPRFEESHRELENVLNAIQDAVFEADLSRKILWCNTAVEKLFGYPPIELIGQSTEMLYAHRTDYEIWASQDALEELRSGPIARQLRYKRKDGSTFTGEVTASLIPDESSAPKRFIGIIRDITARKEEEEELYQRGVRLNRQKMALLELAKYKDEESGEIGKAVQKITEISAQALNVERISVWLYEQNFSRIRCIDLYEKSPSRHSEGFLLASEEYPAYFRAMEENRVIVANDAYNDPATSEFSKNYLTPLGITSMLDAPVRVGGQLVGVVCHEHVGPPRQWTLDEQTFAGSIADMAMLAIERWELKRTEKELRQSQERYHLLLNERLQESQERFRTTFEQAAVGIAHVNADGQFLRVNEKLCQLLGFTRDEMMSINFKSITHPDDIKKSIEFLHQLLSGNLNHATIEKRYIRKDGSFIWGNLTTTVIRNPDNEFKYFISVIEDITERKQLEERRKLYWEIFANSKDGIALIDPEGRYLEQNPAHKALLGYSDEEIRGKTPAIHLGEEIFAKIAGDLEKRGNYRGEVASTRKDGSTAYIDLSAFPVWNESGELACFVGIKRDITDRKRMENELLQQSKMAVIGQMAAWVAHEIRNPLFGISSVAQILARDLAKKPQLKELVESMLSEISRLNKLLESLLLYTQPRRIELEAANLKKLCEETFELQTGIVSSKNLKISTAFAPPDTEIPMDRDQMKQVLLNLFLNAAQASPDNGTIVVESKIHLSSTPFWTFSITNQGEPIQPVHLSSIFQPFFSTKKDGFGLGLSVCRKIVEDHGGTIQCESSKQHGTTFTFRIPLPLDLTEKLNPV